jgi:hypothetical protein
MINPEMLSFAPRMRNFLFLFHDPFSTHSSPQGSLKGAFHVLEFGFLAFFPKKTKYYEKKGTVVSGRGRSEFFFLQLAQTVARRRPQEQKLRVTPSI